MTTTAPWFPGRAVTLVPEACWALMKDTGVGRIAYRGPQGLGVLPVSYVVHERSVVFRVAPAGEIARCVVGREVAFEVDDHNIVSHDGWSVLIRGTTQRVTQTEELPPLDNRPEPWVEGYRWMVLRITPRSITGRQVRALHY